MFSVKNEEVKKLDTHEGHGISRSCPTKVFEFFGCTFKSQSRIKTYLNVILIFAQR